MEKTGVKKIKVLLLLHTLLPGGAPKIGLETFEGLADRTSVWTVAGSGGAWVDRCRKLGKLTVLKPVETGSPPKRMVKRLLHSLCSLGIKRWKPDIIYVNSAASLRLANDLDLPNAPVIVHVHEVDSLLQFHASRYADLLRDWPHRYIAVSDAVRRSLVNGCGVDKDKVTVIYPYLSREAFSQMPESAAPGAGKFRVGGAGYLWWGRGAVLWLQMAAALKEIMGKDAVEFAWVGIADDQEGWQFREIASKLGVADLVECIPPTKEPMKYYETFDVLAMTSWTESFSLVVVEQMALGKPVVCFAGSGGPPEVVGDTGIAVEGFSAHAMAEAIAALARDPERMNALGAAARKRAVEQFHADTQIPKIFEEITDLV